MYCIGSFIVLWTGDALAFLAYASFIILLVLFVKLSLKIIKDKNLFTFVKLLVNTAWNLEAAGAFAYGAYVFSRYKATHKSGDEIIPDFANLHPSFFYLMLLTLTFTVMFRAAISCAELITHKVEINQYENSSDIKAVNINETNAQ